MRQVYIAGKYTAKARLRERKKDVEAIGFAVSSSWMAQDLVDATSSNATKRKEAVRDAHEVLQAEFFILDTLDDSNTGGREVELGLALSRRAHIHLIGPQRNVFHYLPLVKQYNTWEEMIEHMKGHIK